MPAISLDLTIPKDTNKATASPVEVKAYVGPCTIIGIILQFPAGCQYLAKVQVSASLPGNPKMPLLPSTQGSDALDYIALDDFVQFFPMKVKITSNAIIYADGWNEDDTNQHEIKVVVITEIK